MLKLFREALLTVMLLLCCVYAQAIIVTGSIKGKVLSCDGQPLEGVSIVAKDTKFMTLTSEEGIIVIFIISVTCSILVFEDEIRSVTTPYLQGITPSGNIILQADLSALFKGKQVIDFATINKVMGGIKSGMIANNYGSNLFTFIK